MALCQLLGGILSFGLSFKGPKLWKGHSCQGEQNREKTHSLITQLSIDNQTHFLAFLPTNMTQKEAKRTYVKQYII